MCDVDEVVAGLAGVFRVGPRMKLMGVFRCPSFFDTAFTVSKYFPPDGSGSKSSNEVGQSTFFLYGARFVRYEYYGAFVPARVVDAVKDAGDAGALLRVGKGGSPSRSLIDVLNMVNLLPGRGVEVRSISDEIDPATTTGRLMLNMVATLAEYERELIDRTVPPRRDCFWSCGRD